ncbi:hypothetical protein [Vibrio sp. HA2012]|uniref:hypothetical protein n=1 Tax=Vibrio sp. HA2012 TaxID=1971595 RepID=UPI0012FE6E76|nr:hypothetical protein [Vibrio sp. HA2012]
MQTSPAIAKRKPVFSPPQSEYSPVEQTVTHVTCLLTLPAMNASKYILVTVSKMSFRNVTELPAKALTIHSWIAVVS